MIHHFLVESGLNPHEVAVALKDWEILPVMDGETQVGEVMLKASEIHIAFSRVWRGKGLFKKREKVREFFQKLLDERKFLVTRSFDGDYTEPFIRRLGFVKTHSQGNINFWWLDQAPFQRNQT